MRFRRGSSPSEAAASEADILDAPDLSDASDPVDGDVPCTPCEAARKARQFSLNPPAETPMSDDAVPVIAPGVSTDVGDSGVDLSVEGQERTFALNATAGLIWLTIDGQLDVQGIIADLAGETGAPAEQIGPDVRSSIATFLAQGLVTVAPARQSA